jgi:hypothetical protein
MRVGILTRPSMRETSQRRHEEIINGQAVEMQTPPPLALMTTASRVMTRGSAVARGDIFAGKRCDKRAESHSLRSVGGSWCPRCSIVWHSTCVSGRAVVGPPKVRRRNLWSDIVFTRTPGTQLMEKGSERFAEVSTGGSRHRASQETCAFRFPGPVPYRAFLPIERLNLSSLRKKLSTIVAPEWPQATRAG